MSELKPCPFCGKKVYIGLYGGEPDYFWMVHGGMYYDECKCRLFMESCKFELEDESKVDYDEYAMKVRGGLVRRWNSRADYHGYEQAAIEAWENIKAWNARATNGTLTAEQVREAIEANSWAETSSIREFNDSSWQGIADELNSRAERTCKQEERGWSTEGDHARVWLTCGHDCMVPTVQDLPNYCPNCGCKVVGE